MVFFVRIGRKCAGKRSESIRWAQRPKRLPRRHRSRLRTKAFRCWPKWVGQRDRDSGNPRLLSSNRCVFGFITFVSFQSISPIADTPFDSIFYYFLRAIQFFKTCSLKLIFWVSGDSLRNRMCSFELLLEFVV